MPEQTNANVSCYEKVVPMCHAERREASTWATSVAW